VTTSETNGYITCKKKENILMLKLVEIAAMLVFEIAEEFV
jgi:hypothetical protein